MARNKQYHQVKRKSSTMRFVVIGYRTDIGVSYFNAYIPWNTKGKNNLLSSCGQLLKKYGIKFQKVLFVDFTKC